MKLAIVLAALVVAQTASAQAPRGDPAVLAELNWARAHPADYADELRGSERRDEREYASSEGASAIEEAAEFVASQPPRPPLAWSAPLAEAAEDYAEAQGPTGATGHGSNVAARLQRRGGGVVGEIISYGASSPAAVVRQFIVDDGVPNRAHRRIVFSDNYRFAGVACAPHRAYRTMCVVDLASGSGRAESRSR